MSNLISNLLGTTALIHLSKPNSNFSCKPFSSSLEWGTDRANGRMQKLRGQPRQGSTAILVSRQVKVPHLDAQSLSMLHSHKTKLVTRHIESDLLERTLNGSFKFGTISKYRPADTAQIGRFSDFQEGLQRDVFRSRDGVYNAEIEYVSLSNISVVGFENPIVLQFEVNEYCSCSSRGGFDLNRAERFRERGNPDINTYVVYDLEKLVAAVESIISETRDKMHLSLIAREVEYGCKDRHWEVEGRINARSDKDHLAIWLSNIFVKSPDYEHEAELRIVLLDPAKAGLLADDAEPIFLNDPRIANAIIEHGNF